MEYLPPDEKALELAQKREDETKPKRKRKWFLNLMFLLALVVIAGIVWSQYQAPQLRQNEFQFSYGRPLPTDSQTYLRYGRQYEDVSFAKELAAINGIGEYDIEVTFASKTYVLHIHITDDKAPVITFNERDSIYLYSYHGERYIDPIYTIQEDSDYKIAISPALNELESGEQDICVTAIDAFANETTRCRTDDVWKIEPNLVSIPQVNSVEELLAQFMKTKRLTSTNFGFYYYAPYDEETYLYNPDTMFYAASIIKVPLNMLLEDRYANEEMNPQDTIKLLSADVESGAGNTLKQYKVNDQIPYSYLQEQSIVYSDNTATNALVRGLGGFTKFRQLLTSYSEQKLPNNFYTQNVVSMRYMLEVMMHLYEQRSHYDTLIGYMKQANGGEYLQASTDMFEIAQKYGDYDRNLHATGIVYTPKPYIVGIFTYNRSDAEVLIQELNSWLISYQFQKSISDKQKTETNDSPSS